MNQETYEDYKEHLHKLGWIDIPTILNQDSEDFVSINNIKKGSNYRVIDISCPDYTKMCVSTNHSLGLYIVNENGLEISDDTKIKVIFLEPSVTYLPILNILYSEIKMKNEIPKCKLKKTICLRGGTYIYIDINNSKSYISKENIKFKITCDKWHKNKLIIDNNKRNLMKIDLEKILDRTLDDLQDKDLIEIQEILTEILNKINEKINH